MDMYGYVKVIKHVSRLGPAEARMFKEVNSDILKNRLLKGLSCKCYFNMLKFA